MLLLILQCFYFMFPAYFANMAPVIFKNKFKKLAIPVDFGKNIFGNNKTYRGLIFGVLFSIIVAYLQFFLARFPFFASLGFVDYSNWFLIGFFMGFGAIFGDMIESFVKRRLKIKPGQKFIPWDQLDFVIGALVFVSLIVTLSWIKVFLIAIISVVGHILVNHSAYYLGIRKERW